MESSIPVSNTRPNKPKAARPILLIAVAIVAAAAIAMVLWVSLFRFQGVQDPSTNLIAAGFTSSGPHTLDPAYKDLNGDLIADPPTNPAQFIDPATLVFTFVATDDAKENKQQWQPLTDYLSKATGRPVEYLLVTSTHDELKAMHDGQLQIAGFNTGAVPPAVNRSGFVPVCALPTSDGGDRTHTDIIVPSDSPLHSPEDLKGHELTLTDPDSNSGYKAPLVLLREQFGLQPLSDIHLRYSQSHNASITGIVEHKYEAAAVADDMLSRQVSTAAVSADSFRVIFKSEDFPTAGLGYVYNLKPELAQKVRDALLSFDWKGTPLEKLLKTSSQTKFVPVDYKNDWRLVRKIDDQMGLLSGF